MKQSFKHNFAAATLVVFSTVGGAVTVAAAYQGAIAARDGLIEKYHIQTNGERSIGWPLGAVAGGGLGFWLARRKNKALRPG